MSVHSVTVAKVVCFVCVYVRDRDSGVNRAASRVEDPAKDSTKISKLDFFLLWILFLLDGAKLAVSPGAPSLCQAKLSISWVFIDLLNLQI